MSSVPLSPTYLFGSNLQLLYEVLRVTVLPNFCVRKRRGGDRGMNLVRLFNLCVCCVK